MVWPLVLAGLLQHNAALGDLISRCHFARIQDQGFTRTQSTEADRWSVQNRILLAILED